MLDIIYLCAKKKKKLLRSDYIKENLNTNDQ